VIYVCIVAFDIGLAAHGRLTISEWTWQFCDSHKALIAFGPLVFLSLSALVYKWWWMVFLEGLTAGHLFFHW
jgi:hypothetical protein